MIVKTAVATAAPHFRVRVMTVSEHLSGELPNGVWQDATLCLDKVSADLIAGRLSMCAEVRECDCADPALAAPLVEVTNVSLLDDNVA